jgi:hypothetical protein
MSMDDVSKTDSEQDSKQAPQKQCGCSCRKLRRFLLLLLVIVVVGGGALYWNFFLRVYNLNVCQEALRTIAADKGMQEALGQPIKNVYWPSQETAPNARVEESEIDVRWTIEGPKKQARAHLLAKKRQGTWDVVVIEVTPTGGKKVSIHEANNGEGDAPVFQGAKPEPPKTDGKIPDTKGPDINMPIPPGDAPTDAK